MRDTRAMRTACTLASFTLFTSLLLTPLAPAQQKAPAAAPAASNDALTVYTSGVDGLLVDPKDAGLLRALKMLDERVLELPRETGDERMPAPAIQLALQLLMNPMSMRAGLLDMNEQREGPPFYAQLSFYGTPDAAADFAGRFTALIKQAGAPPATPAANIPGMQSVDADGAPIYFGTMKGANGSAFVLGVNQVSPPNMPAFASGLPKDIKPAMTFTLDMKKLQPLMDMFMAQAGPEADMLKSQLAMSGFYGPDASQLTAAIGHGKDRTFGWGKYTNYRKMLEAGGALPDSLLKLDDLKRVPGDATYAQVSKMNLNGIMNMIKSVASQAMQQQGMGGDDAAQDPFKFIEDATGINPQRDIVDNLGQTFGSYMSETTGGGGLASVVFFAEVKNSEALEATRARIRGMINQIGQDKAKGYVRVDEREMAGHKVLALTFPGLPIPIEICSTVADGYVYAAGSMNALSAAVAQGKSGSRNLAENDHFKEMGGREMKDAMQVTFVDTPHMLSQGYGLVSMGMTALGNAVRSPTDLKRDAGLIMPSYAELAKDAHATVSIMRLEGNDMVVTSQGDRSLLVNACGAAGAIGGVTGAVAIGAMFAGLVTPSMTHAREQAVEMSSMSGLRNVAMSYVVYAADKQDALPTSADDLVAAGYLEAGMLESPFGPMNDGSAAIWLNPKGGKTSEISDPATYIIAYDRAMFANGEVVAVAFLDGHVEQISRDELRTQTQSDQHKGIDFKLPG